MLEQVNLLERLDLEQGSQEWLDFRQQHIGASDAPIIMGVSPWKTPFQLWQEKTGRVIPPPMNMSQSRGHRLEPISRAWFESKMDILVPDAVVQHPDIPYMSASLDGLSFCQTVILEIKNVNAVDHKTALLGGVPVKYKIQLDHQLACFPHIKFAYYLSYNEIKPQESAIVEYPRCEKAIAKLLKKNEEFWKCIETDTPPELTERDYTERKDIEWQNAANNWHEIYTELKKLEAKEKDAKKVLTDLAGNKNCMGHGVKMLKVERKGAIQYKDVPDLDNIDLEKYRKKPSQYWKASLYTE